MKKIFTLLFAVGMFTLAQAQPGYRDNRQNGGIIINQPYDRGDSRYDNDRFSFERKRDMEIARINREYDYKIQRVRNNFFMGRFEKERQIRFLQEQRQREVRIVYARFSGRHHYDDHSNRHY